MTNLYYAWPVNTPTLIDDIFFKRGMMIINTRDIIFFPLKNNKLVDVHFFGAFGLLCDCPLWFKHTSAVTPHAGCRRRGVRILNHPQTLQPRLKQFFDYVKPCARS
jgi:hypothetical protein